MGNDTLYIWLYATFFLFSRHASTKGISLYCRYTFFSSFHCFLKSIVCVSLTTKRTCHKFELILDYKNFDGLLLPTIFFLQCYIRQHISCKFFKLKAKILIYIRNFQASVYFLKLDDIFRIKYILLK